MIEVQDLSFGYKGQGKLFEGLNFTLEDGCSALVSGASGCGKTTLLFCLCGIIPRSVGGEFSGSVRIDHIPVGEYSPAGLPHAAGMVFQDPAGRMFCRTVEDEIAFTMENLCIPRDEMHKKIDWALSLTGLKDRMENPENLSGGQQKILALASVLVIKPRVLLLDEVTAGLDEQAVIRVKNCVGQMKEEGCTVIISDHRKNLWETDQTIDLPGTQKGGDL